MRMTAMTTAGDCGTATAGQHGTATAGHEGTAIAGISGTAITGHSGRIIIKHSGGVGVVEGRVGVDGIKANHRYRAMHGKLALVTA